jgi:hypothetical protein
LKNETWHHYAVTINETGDINIYIDGFHKNKDSTGNGTGVVNSVERAQSYIGKSNWEHDSAFEGTIDELYVFGRILKEEEIKCFAD